MALGCENIAAGERERKGKRRLKMGLGRRKMGEAESRKLWEVAD